ncbi:MAG: hypothetical protein FJZ16_02840 [Candidatus Omnitrophica bacterium]|nr:hypothetical protein [Candidatus Omnitrophota bacterium]
MGNLEMQGGQTLNLDAGNYFLTKLTTRNSLGNIPPPQIYATGKITLYVDGDIDVKRLYIYGQNTDPTKVTIKVIGDHDVKIENESHIHGVVYAPNSEVKLKQSTVWGAVIGDEIKVDGSATIHYDEALSTSGDYISGTTVDVLSWREPN